MTLNNEGSQVIGLGTWMDKVAYRVIQREKELGRSTELLRTESGLGPSGIPHIGNMGDVIRAYGITLALRNMGYDSEYVFFTDDMDGLRKVPAGFPKWLEDYLLMPVSTIPDPFGCHDSYGDHMTYILREAVDEIGIDYKFFSSKDVYGSGKMKEFIEASLIKAKVIGEKIRELTGQAKYVNTLPYFPLCSKCNRIYTTLPKSFDRKGNKVYYVCVGIKIKNRYYEGCGNEGEADITKAEGKLPWKVDFAARWKLLDIRFEPYGKDIADSIKVADWISKNIFGFEPPLHVKYEMFLNEEGKRLSSSAGNVINPQEWYNYGTPQSLLLLMFKRSVGTRTVSYKMIPKLMDELDLLEDVYFGKVKLEDKREEAKLKGLYCYVNLLKPPKTPSAHVPYGLILELASISPPGDEANFIASRLQRYGYRLDDNVSKKIKLAINYHKSFGTKQEIRVELLDKEKLAISKLVEKIRASSNPRELQSSIFDIARESNIEPPEFFKKLYTILIGSDKGPRLGNYIFDVGKEKVVEILSRYLRS